MGLSLKTRTEFRGTIVPFAASGASSGSCVFSSVKPVPWWACLSSSVPRLCLGDLRIPLCSDEIPVGLLGLDFLSGSCLGPQSGVVVLLLSQSHHGCSSHPSGWEGLAQYLCVAVLPVSISGFCARHIQQSRVRLL